MMKRCIPNIIDIPMSPSRFKRIQQRGLPGQTVRVPLPNLFAVMAIEAYQKYTVDKPHVCNHIPSCSEYGRIAFIQYNFVLASLLTAERLKECSDIMSNWPRRNRP